MKLALSLLALTTTVLVFLISWPNPPRVLPSALLVSPAPLSSPTPSPKPEYLTVLFVGDVMLGRSVNLNSQKYGYTWPFLKVKELVSQADLAFANLENPIVANCPPTDTGFKFCSPPESVEGLTFAGFDVLSLANNHTTNYGPEGLASTKNLLNQANIASVGVGKKPAILRVKGKTIAFFAYEDVGHYPALNPAVQTELVTDLQTLAPDADLTFVSFHFGNEYVATASSRQRQLARLAVDAGADAIIGHHPHWVQDHEIYQGKPIYYSLGNFVFDQEWSQETKSGMALHLSYSGQELISIETIPIYIENYGQSSIAENAIVL